MSNIQHPQWGIRGGVSGDEAEGVVRKLGVLTPWGGVENSLVEDGTDAGASH